MNVDQLIHKCIKKDRKAQETLYNTYRRKLFPVCLKYCRSRSEAEDHLHDVFIEIFDKIRTYSRKGSFEGWMKRIAINKAIDKYTHLPEVPGWSLAKKIRARERAVAEAIAYQGFPVVPQRAFRLRHVPGGTPEYMCSHPFRIPWM